MKNLHQRLELKQAETRKSLYFSDLCLFSVFSKPITSPASVIINLGWAIVGMSDQI